MRNLAFVFSFVFVACGADHESKPKTPTAMAAPVPGAIAIAPGAAPDPDESLTNLYPEYEGFWINRGGKTWEKRPPTLKEPNFVQILRISRHGAVEVFLTSEPMMFLPGGHDNLHLRTNKKAEVQIVGTSKYWLTDTLTLAKDKKSFIARSQVTIKKKVHKSASVYHRIPDALANEFRTQQRQAEIALVKSLLGSWEVTRVEKRKSHKHRWKVTNHGKFFIEVELMNELGKEFLKKYKVKGLTFHPDGRLHFETRHGPARSFYDLFRATTEAGSEPPVFVYQSTARGWDLRERGPKNFNLVVVERADKDELLLRFQGIRVTVQRQKK